MGKYSFPKTGRLLKRADFVRLSKSGRKFHSNHFIAAVSEVDTDHTRIGITVTKRVGNAVNRNRIKRLGREYIRLNKQDITGRRDINIIAKTGAARLSSEQIFDSLRTVFKKVARKYDY